MCIIFQKKMNIYKSCFENVKTITINIKKLDVIKINVQIAMIHIGQIKMET